MRGTDWLARVVTTYSKSAIAVMLVASLLMGAGVLQLDQSPGLDQFEFDTEEGDALEYVEAHFDVDANETPVQIVIRDQENALSQESLLQTLELQTAIAEDPAINETLSDDPFNDLASIVATQAIVDDELDNLSAEEAAIENESEDLNATATELEADADALEEDAADLEADAEEFEERQAQFETDRAALENRSMVLQQALEDVVAIQVELETGERSESEADAAVEQTLDDAESEAELDAEQSDTFRAVADDVRTTASLEFERDAAIESGPADITDDTQAQASLAEALNETVELQTAYDEAETDEERDEIDAQIETTWVAAIDEADLDAEQETAFRDLGTDIRDTQSQINDIGPMSVLFEAGTQGVLADEFEQIEERGEVIESDAAELEERQDALDARADDIDDRAEDMEDREEALTDRSEQLADEYEALADIDPTRSEQREQLAQMSDEDVATIIEDLLGADADPALYAFVPTDFNPGDTETDARQLLVSQEVEDEVIEGEAPERIVDAQLAMAGHVSEQFGESGFTFGAGIITDEIERSMSDSLAVVLPLALLFVVVVLTIAYRDPLDILLGVFGIGLVLLWTFGFMGWAGIVFNQIMIAVPVLLVGLSIDYAIHVFMRHRERRAEKTDGSRAAMAVVVMGLGAALLWVTITAVIGFLSNVVSPVPPIQEFGIVSAVGIIATLLVFGILIPATKVTLDEVLEQRGYDRTKRAFGTGGGKLTELLQTGNHLAQRIPVGVVLVALLLTGAGIYGAAQVDTTFEQEDFIADEPPEWMDRLPAGIAPGEYTVKSQLDFVNERFVRQDAATQILVRGDITADDTLEDFADAEDQAGAEAVVVRLPDDNPDVQTPLTVMSDLAEDDEDFAAVFDEADSTGDAVPDHNITAVYDAFYAADSDQAERFLHRTDDGEYVAARMSMSMTGDTTGEEATAATERVAVPLEHMDRTATPTGQLVVFHIIEDGLFDAVIESLIVTFVAVFAFLMVAYRVVHGSAILGAVTLLPILFTVAWILGTMYVLAIPFNVMTGTITSLTIGLGVAYNIHISERYRLETQNGYSPSTSLQRAVTGTGGALLGSAATTIGGFGVLIFAILPPLQQFGLITGLTILYAFLGSVFVLPSFLALWTLYIDS